MPQPLNGLILNEGFTNLGNFEINVTNIEQVQNATGADSTINVKTDPVVPLLFQFVFADGTIVPADYNITFETSVIGTDDAVSTTANPAVDGYAQLVPPRFPIVKRNADGNFPVFHYAIDGDLNSRQKECYLELSNPDGSGTTVYTLISDFCVTDSKLSVKAGDGAVYALHPSLIIESDYTALYFTDKGMVYGYSSRTRLWVLIGNMRFKTFEFPNRFTIIQDGFYEENGDTGATQIGNLGDIDTPFEKFRGTLRWSDLFKVNVSISIAHPDDAITSESFSFPNLEPGNLDINIATLTNAPYVTPDTSPTLAAIESISGETLSGEFTSFLNTRSLTSMDKLRRAGPISFIEGYEAADLNPEEVALIQAHSDLYGINPNTTQNQRIISQGFNSLVSIANLPKSDFVNAVNNEDLSVFDAARIHEVAVQNLRMTSNLLAATLNELQLQNPQLRTVPASNFQQSELAPAVNSCGCDDCKSNISPFAYLMDLLNYGAASIKVSNVGYANNVPAFITLLTTKFLQPFGDFQVDCKTLHDEFCRVRLVTEVLEKRVGELAALNPSGISQLQLNKLTTERAQYVMLVYQSILTQMGTSFGELRKIVTTTNAAEKLKAAESLCNRLGLPVYVPSTTTLVVDRLWLTAGNTNSANDLIASNLESVFGFRDTQRNVLMPTPVSEVETWQAAYLRDVWKKQDYFTNEYTREGMNASNLASIKANWKPIIDPDFMGLEDITYRPNNFAPTLWRARKQDTDAFLDWVVNGSTHQEVLNVDIDKRIVRVPMRNLSGDVIENDEVLLSLNGNNPWIAYNVYGKTLNGIATDIVLKKSSIASPQPMLYHSTSNNPSIRYNRVVQVAPSDLNLVPGSIDTYSIVWNEPTILDAASFSLLTVKISSTIGNTTTIYENTIGATNLITNFNILSSTQVEFDIPGNLPSGFNGAGASLRFTYTVSFKMNREEVVKPNVLVDELFLQPQSYTLQPGATPASPHNYFVWKNLTPTSPRVTIQDEWDYVFGTSGLSYYDNLKRLLIAVNSGNLSAPLQSFLDTNLRMSRAEFIRLMVVLKQCELYTTSMFSTTRPTNDELFELASILRVCAKKQLEPVWVEEEVTADNQGVPLELALNKSDFWNALEEPIGGLWDSRLQSNSLSSIFSTATDTPIIDPELLDRSELQDSPSAATYRLLYESRKADLQLKRDAFRSALQLQLPGGIETILREINTGSGLTAYTIPNYSSVTTVLNDLNGSDTIAQQHAKNAIQNAFRMEEGDFKYIALVKFNLESNNPALLPTLSEIDKCARILCSAFKRKQLWSGSMINWIVEEQTGTTPNMPTYPPVFYYNVRKMNLAAVRGNSEARTAWKKALEAWSRLPIVHPDIVPIENIKNFTPANPISVMWSNRKSALTNEQNTFTSLLSNTQAPAAILTNLKDLIALVISRDVTSVNVSQVLYMTYFNELRTRLANKEDIRPYLQRYNMTYEQFTTVNKVYDILVAEGAQATTNLLKEELKEVADIFIRIRTLNLSYPLVVEEYTANIRLIPDAFLIFKTLPNTYPLTDLPKYNKWRSPSRDRKVWKDTLEGRIDREKAVKENWQKVLEEAEDRNMPLMRDALIRALSNPCEGFQDAAERLAKTFFIETKDNCCVKHTRVSFAIETIQGLFFALENGVFDTSISNFTLHAPNFKEEWKWLGSYAAWRGAMFVHLYPENMLYPTLKRRQSPAFVELAEKLRNNNRLSPEGACEAAKEYQSYLEDVTNLSVSHVCETSIKIELDETSDCCGEVIPSTDVTFIFANTITSKSYYKIVDATNPDKIVRFWTRLELPEEAGIIGSYSVNHATNAGQNKRYLYLFYSYIEQGKTVIGDIKLDLDDSKLKWAEAAELGELPKYPNFEFRTILALQQNNPDVNPSFLVSYVNRTNNTVNYVVTKYSILEEEFIGENNGAVVYTHSNSLPLAPFSCLRFDVKDSLNASPNQAIVISFQDFLIFRVLGKTSTNYNIVDNPLAPPLPSISPTAPQPPFSEVVKILPCSEQNTILVIDRLVFGSALLKKIKFSFNQSSNTITNSAPVITNVNTFGYTQTILDDVETVSDVSSHFGLSDPYVAINTFQNGLQVGGKLSLNVPMVIFNMTFYFNGLLYPTHLIPYLILEPIESDDCIQNIGARKNSIQNTMKFNKRSVDGGNTPLDLLCLKSNYELLREAYYFVPLLIALDLQRRGQYESALAWYRSIYDYTDSNLGNRKVYYELVTEGNINNTFTRTLSNWLLDPLNPHGIAETRRNAYTKYTVVNIVQCLYAYADRLFTQDTIETVPQARKLYSTALELLDIPELELRENLCLTAANACLANATPTEVDEEYSSTFHGLRMALQQLRSNTLISTVGTQIEVLLNNAAQNRNTLPQAFADAFALIESSRPLANASLTVNDVITNHTANLANANRYFNAAYNLNEINVEQGQIFAEQVATLSALTTKQLKESNYSARLQWLQQALPANNTTYQFNFRHANGEQILDIENVYNPITPSASSYQANVDYSNAPSLLSARTASYIPLMHYTFCSPKNPIYSSLVLKGNLELYKIFNCRNIGGMVRELSPFSAATDSNTGIPVIGASGTLNVPGSNNFSPSQYRFRVLIERAKQINQQAQQMESLFLAALEKEDAENYAQLRAKQDLDTAKATIKLQDLRINQAKSERGLADLQLDKVSFTLDYYEGLLSAGLLNQEQASLDLLSAAQILQYVSAAASAVSAGIFFGLGPIRAEQIGSAWGALASASSSISAALSTQASIFSQQASYFRRTQEWEFQKNLAGKDINIANQQIKIAEDNIRIVSQEREIAVLNSTHASDSLEFLRNKFTNAELYNWMGNVLERSYNYLLNLSTAIARTAEGQLYFERQEQAGPFILNDYWETPSAGNTSGSSKDKTDRRGLTGSARLLVDLNRLEQYAFETNKRKLQLTKTISLAQNFPSEFQRFKETGVLNFALTNQLFDYDFPGHYLRLINSVKTTVVGLIPTYDGIKATLTADAISYTVIGGTTFQRTPIRRLEIDSVALTSPNNATGVFELQAAQGELLNPFEGMGIESRWEFKMPQFSNRMNFDNIGDVLLQVEYTALDSYQYRYQVLQELEDSISFNRGFSFKNNFPDQWYELLQAPSGSNLYSVEIDLKREFFPDGIEDLKLDQSIDIVLYFVRDKSFEDEISVANFNLASSANSLDGVTVKGKLSTQGLMNAIGQDATPVMKLKLAFDGADTDAQLFTDGKIKDILLLIPCKGTLMSYPL